MCQAARLLRAAAATEPEWRTKWAQRRAPYSAGGEDRLVLLGTAGGANPKATRSGFSNALVVGSTAYIVDCGEGVHPQLQRAGITVNPTMAPPGTPRVTTVFLTHLHSDHLIDFPNLFFGGWPNQPIAIYGPGPAGMPIPLFPPDRPAPQLAFADEPTPGLKALADKLFGAFAYNINTRIFDEGRAWQLAPRPPRSHRPTPVRSSASS